MSHDPLKTRRDPMADCPVPVGGVPGPDHGVVPGRTWPTHGLGDAQPAAARRKPGAIPNRPAPSAVPCRAAADGASSPACNITPAGFRGHRRREYLDLPSPRSQRRAPPVVRRPRCISPGGALDSGNSGLNELRREPGDDSVRHASRLLADCFRSTRSALGALPGN